MSQLLLSDGYEIPEWMIIVHRLDGCYESVRAIMTPYYLGYRTPTPGQLAMVEDWRQAIRAHCRHCGMIRARHKGYKCLFESTRFLACEP